jgi:hypothetical protein
MVDRFIIRGYEKELACSLHAFIHQRGNQIEALEEVGVSVLLINGETGVDA